MTTQSELRDALDYIKAESGSGSKQRKQDRFVEVYTPAVGHIVCGERYDDAGVGPATAESAVENVFPELEVDDYPTISEALASLDLDTNDRANMLDSLTSDLDGIARASGNEQQKDLEAALERHAEPSLVTLALLDDESIGLGTSQMREAFFDGTRSERKRREALVPTTTEFIRRAREGSLPTEPELFQPFDPMLAKPESAGKPDDCVAQFKVDGYRLLVHVRSQEQTASVRAYTRNRKDVTHSLPELQEIDWPHGDYIIDCEVIAEDGSYSTTSSRVGSNADNIDRSTEMEFACFDLLMVKGRDLTQQPLKKRYNFLETLTMVSIDDPRIYMLEMSSNVSKVREVAIDEGYEGVILKDLQGEYELGTRSSSWVKEKHEREHIDVRVVDVIEGNGEAAGQLGKFHVESKEGEPLGGVGTGFTDQLARRVWRNSDDWIGGTIEVSAEAYDPSGDGGLRFPVYERDRRDDGEPDSIDKVEKLLDVA